MGFVCECLNQLHVRVEEVIGWAQDVSAAFARRLATVMEGGL